MNAYLYILFSPSRYFSLNSVFKGDRTALMALRTHFPKHPIAVGFGISTVEQAQTVAQFSDAMHHV